MTRLSRLLLLADTARRLGPHAVGHWVLHRLTQARGPLRDEAMPGGLASLFIQPPPPAPGGLPAHQAERIFAAADAVIVTPDWHGPFPAVLPANSLDLFAPGDIRPLWERHRLAALPLLAQAQRLAPTEGHACRAGALLADWAERNPGYRGPAWACGQEAAFRALHLMLALALLEQDRAPQPPARALLALLARRIGATPHYAAAQDNNHPVSEAAGLFLCGLGLGDAALTRRGSQRLSASLGRLVTAEGAFAQVSTGYHRLLLDTLSLAEWFRRRHGAPPFPAPFAERAAAAAAWLLPLVDPATGAMPRLGHLDDSALADLSLTGPADARGTLERAARLFLQASAGFPEDAGCAWLGLPVPARDLDRPAAWLEADPAGRRQEAPTARTAAPPRRQGRGATGPEGQHGAFGAGKPDSRQGRHGDERPGGRTAARPGDGAAGPDIQATASGTDQHRETSAPSAKAGPTRAATWQGGTLLGWQVGQARLFLRVGTPRFRPGHADLLHVELWDGERALLRDGGTGAYNPRSDQAWWLTHFQGTAAHNTIAFDDADQMPRLSRFLFGRWPRCQALPDGGMLTDWRGNRQERRISREGRDWLVEDKVAGSFRSLISRWHLPPGDWIIRPDGVEGAAGRLRLNADAPFEIRLVEGWYSPAYGRVEQAPVLELRTAAPVSRLSTRITLPLAMPRMAGEAPASSNDNHQRRQAMRKGPHGAGPGAGLGHGQFDG